MPDEIPEPSPSTAATLGRLGRVVLATLSNRAELLLVEAQEEGQRLLQATLIVACLIVTSALTLVLLNLTIVVIFWEHRIATLVILSLLHLIASLAGFFQLRRFLRQWQAFSGTLGELRKDRECLR